LPDLLDPFTAPEELLELVDLIYFFPFADYIIAQALVNVNSIFQKNLKITSLCKQGISPVETYSRLVQKSVKFP
jgi:hypothetical protein